MNIRQEPVEKHVDTNCFFLLRGAYHTLPIWGLLPKDVSPVGDRFFYGALKNLDLKPAVATKITVNYQSLYEINYRTLGETPPPGAKPGVDGHQIQNWKDSLSKRDLV